MQTSAPATPVWSAASLRWALLGCLTLLLLPAPSRSQAVWPPANLTKPSVGVVTAARSLSPCPLPPVSAYSLQTNFRKYLVTWPTPGSTATEDWPEYFPEDEEDLG
jgi:hypothetical protein